MLPTPWAYRACMVYSGKQSLPAHLSCHLHLGQDFGLARTLAHRGDTLPSLAPADGATVVTTHGYVAPEYARTGE